MKRLVCLTSALLVVSNFAMAKVSIARGSLSEKISNNTKALILDFSVSNVSIKRDAGADSISVKVNLVGESESKISKYQSNWELRSSGSDLVTFTIAPIATIATVTCKKNIVNGQYTKLKGVCVEDIVVTIPEGLKINISNDKKIIKLSDRNSLQKSYVTVRAQDVKRLITNIESASFDSDKEVVLERFVQDQKVIGTNRLTVEDLVSIVKNANFDDEKIQAIASLSSLITERLEAYQAVSELLSFDSSKNQAMTILLK